MSASNKEEFLAIKEQFISENENPVLLEIFTDADDEVVAMNTLISSNKSAEGKIKGVIAKVLGEKGVQTVKKIIGR